MANLWIWKRPLTRLNECNVDCVEGGKLLSGMKSFYKDAHPCVKVNGEAEESIRIYGQTEICNATVAVHSIHGAVREMEAGVQTVLNGR